MLIGSKDFEINKHYLVEIAKDSFVVETFVLKCNGFDPSNNPNLIDIVSGSKHEVSHRYYYYECEFSNENLPPSTGHNLFVAHVTINSIGMSESWFEFLTNKYETRNVARWTFPRQGIYYRVNDRNRVNQIMDGSELEGNGRFNIDHSFDERQPEVADDKKIKALTNIIACYIPVSAIVNVKIDKHGLLKEVLPIQNWSGYAPIPWYARNILATNSLSTLVEKPINKLGLKPGIYRLSVD